MNRRMLLWVAAFLLVTGSLVFWLLIAHTDEPSNDVVEEEIESSEGRRDAGTALGTANRQLDEPPTRPEQTASQSSQLPPLPSLDQPLAEQLDSLIVRSEAGDDVATCRLAVEVPKCLSYIQREQFRRRMEESLAQTPRSSEDLVIGLLAKDEHRSSNGSGHCEGVTVEELRAASAIPAQRTATLSSQQKVILALTRTDGTLMRLPRSPEHLQGRTYDPHAVYSQFLSDFQYAFLEQGIESSDPLALEGMLIIHAPSWIPGTEGIGISLPNARKYAFYALLMKNIYGPLSLGDFAEQALAGALQSLPEEEVARLEEAVELEAQRWMNRPQRTESIPAQYAGQDGAQLCS